jgi:hypothetical protein
MVILLVSRSFSMIRNVGVFAFALIVMSATAGSAFASVRVPEIDPSSVLSAVTLLSGGLLILKDRRRAK